MNTHMFKKAALAIFLCCSQIASGSEVENNFYRNGYGQEEQCQDQSCHFVLSGELLYLKPTVDQSSYVISSSQNVVAGEFFPNGKRHNIHSSYKPGFRLEGIYELCNGESALDFRFAYFKAGHSDSVTGDFLFDTIGFPGDGAQAPEDTSYAGKASIHDHYRYYAFDTTFNRLSLCSCFDNLYLLIGLHYANIEHRTHFTSVGTFISDAATRPINNTLKSHSDFWGIGPQLGLDYNYNLTSADCCYGEFTLNASMRGALLCSNSNSSFHYNTLRTAGTEGVNLKNDNLWRVTPTFDARLGGSYRLSCFCVDTIIELGYEWIWYHNGVDSIRGIDVAFAGDSIDVFSNLSLHGPFLKISVAF